MPYPVTKEEVESQDEMKAAGMLRHGGGDIHSFNHGYDAAVEDMVKFGSWYSGMEEREIWRLYQTFLLERKNEIDQENNSGT